MFPSGESSLQEKSTEKEVGQEVPSGAYPETREARARCSHRVKVVCLFLMSLDLPIRGMKDVPLSSGTTSANLTISVIHQSLRQETSISDCEEKCTQNSCRNTENDAFTCELL